MVYVRKYLKEHGTLYGDASERLTGDTAGEPRLLLCPGDYPLPERSIVQRYPIQLRPEHGL
jgi:hypothetical protein